MKELTYANRTVLLGDLAADLIIELSAVLAETDHADSVTLNVVDTNGVAEAASFVLGTGTNVMAETSSSTLEEPDNEEGVAYMRSKLHSLVNPRTAVPESEPWLSTDEFDFLGDDH